VEVPDAAREHGARVAPNIREWWPNLTDRDIQALSGWRWRAHPAGPQDTPGLSARSLGRRWFRLRLFGREEIGR
jgi:hypothetical protein